MLRSEIRISDYKKPWSSEILRGVRSMWECVNASDFGD
jgi:hypothetical protein